MNRMTKLLKHLLGEIRRHFMLDYSILVITSMMMAGTFVIRANIEKSLFDNAYQFYLTPSTTHRNGILIAFALFVGIYALTQTIAQGSNYIEEILQSKLEKKLSLQLSEKVSRLSATYFEDVRFLEKLEKAQNGKDDAINILMCTTALATYYLPYIIFMAIWLWEQSVLLVVVIVLAFIPTVVSYSVQIKMYAEKEDHVAQLRRKEKAYEACLIGKGQEKETRLLGGHGFFINRLKEVLIQIGSFDLKVLKRRQKTNLCLKAIQSLSFVSIILIAMFLTAKGKISIGAFAALFTSIDILYSNLNEAVSRQYASISQSMGTVENYYHFFEDNGYVLSKGHNGPITKVENLSFKYPNSNLETLKNITFDIRAKERVAIVGENGAGKSTLTKLLLGIYQPTQGKIHTTPNEHYRYTAVFQNYMKYAMTVQENVQFTPDDHRKGIHRVLSESGLNMSKEKFTTGVETALGKEFGGIELSGGEWQKLAIARGIYQAFDFIVFDEPTASIDPIEESNINHMIQAVTADKTSFVVTHRMATVKLADRILVLKEGQLVEDGTHEALIKLKGEYFRLYESQKNNYCEA